MMGVSVMDGMSDVWAFVEASGHSRFAHRDNAAAWEKLPKSFRCISRISKVISDLEYALGFRWLIEMHVRGADHLTRAPFWTGGVVVFDELKQA